MFGWQVGVYSCRLPCARGEDDGSYTNPLKLTKDPHRSPPAPTSGLYSRASKFPQPLTIQVHRSGATPMSAETKPIERALLVERLPHPRHRLCSVQF